MKRKLLLLISCTVALSGSINAQVANPKYSASSKPFKAVYKEDGTSSQVAPAKTPSASHRTAPSKNQTSAVSVVQIGTTPNCFGVANNSRSNINYNKDLNSVVIIHRGNKPPAPTTGYYYYDISSDGGSTWLLDQGPIYSDPKGAGDWYRGRYPVADIYNPSGNTNLANAYLPYAGPWNFGPTAPAWPGTVFGTGALNNTGAKSHVDSLTMGFMENVFVTKPGTVWRVGEEYVFGPSNTFNEKLNFDKGTFNSGTNDFDYKDFDFDCPVDMTGFGGVADADVVFADDGLTGYLVIITNNDDAGGHACFVDTTSYLTVYKTTDGGATWGSNKDLDFSKTADALLGNGPQYSYSAGIDMDIVVDANKNLHILTSVHVSSGYTYYFTPGTWGMLDIYTTDQGTTWHGELLDKPETYRGAFGNGVGPNETLNEYARPFASRTDDGTKLFFGWFDTDTLLFAGVGNTQPNLHVKGYDLTSDKWTAAMDLTSGTDADGLCTFGNGSYYVIENGTSFGIPVFFQSLVDINSTGVPTQLNYIDGAVVNASDFTVTGSPITVNVATCTPVQPPHVLDAIAEFGDPNRLSVSGNYPNPFTGTTTVVVSIPKPGDVTIEVSNMVGQTLSTKTYKNLMAGKNNLTIDCSDYAAGLYIYKVKAGADVISNTMSVR